jgi:cell shape-determining protein MreC
MSPARRETLCLIAMLGVAAGLVVAPPRLQDRVRGTLRDVASPAQRLVRRGTEWASEFVQRRMKRPDGSEQAAELLQQELAVARRRIRELEVAVATVHEEKAELQLTGVAPWRGKPGAPLIVDELVPATVLGAENVDLVRHGKLLDAGTSDGVRESSLVLDDPRPLIDQGESTGLSAGQSVFAGRCIVGRVARVGHWVSTVLPVSDPEFRGLARIIRGEGDQTVFGAEGLLEGFSDGLCRLKHIPATEPVSEGDRVYTAGGDATGPAPMMYGTVVSAELATGASHWDVVVKPAVDAARVRTVQVLRKDRNLRSIDETTTDAGERRGPRG